jgi:hypothetical protein
LSAAKHAALKQDRVDVGAAHAAERHRAAIELPRESAAPAN